MDGMFNTVLNFTPKKSDDEMRWLIERTLSDDEMRWLIERILLRGKEPLLVIKGF